MQSKLAALPALVLVTAMLPLGSVVAAPTDPCIAAISETRAEIIAQAESVSFADAVQLVADKVAPPCGLDLQRSAKAEDPPIDLKLAEAGIEPRCEYRPDGCRDMPGDEGLDVDATSYLLGAAEVVPCSLPGKGAGSIEGYVLGVLVGNWSGYGEWTPVSTQLKVAGDSGLFGGVQIDSVGTVLVGPLTLPATGGTEAYCLQSTTTTAVKKTCWWLVVYTSCTTEVSSSVVLVPCRAEAEQYVLSPDLIRLDHRYAESSNPC